MTDLLDLKEFQTDIVTISLKLTNKCPFECAHCGYACGPNVRSGHMSTDTMHKVKTWVDYLDNLDIQTEINLIGGEPTMHWQTFENALEIFGPMAYSGRLSMVTNGWWMSQRATLRKFMRLVSPYVGSDGDREDSIVVRVSNDPFHARFHDNWMIKAIMHDKETLWDNYWDFTGDDFRLPSPGYWFDVDSPHAFSSGWVLPQGRAAENGIGVNNYTCRTNGWKDVTYEPNGKVSDTCCRFSDMDGIGTVDDNPLTVMNTVHQFMRAKEPSCWECKDLWCEFRGERKLAHAKRLAEAQTFLIEKEADKDVD